MKILLVDDDSAIRKSIKLILLGEPYIILESADTEDAYQKIINERPDIVLLDVHFKSGTSLSLMKRLLEEHMRVPIVMLSGAATPAEAAEAIRYGAYDYIEKPISAERLKLTLARCFENAKLQEKLHSITVQSNKRTEVLGSSGAIVRIKNLIHQYSKKDIKVLVTGETGVGKEVIAHSIWQNSDRMEKPFIIVNSAAIPENLIESELFGHKKGSFTGAINDQVGKIEMADRGTLFLDEVGDLSFSAQTKLLRFLETGEVQKIGTTQSRVVDVRLICATSRDLEKELEKKHFRSDLFYRLNVVRIHIPPLRDRVEDIPILFANFVQSFCRKFGEEEKTIDAGVYEFLKSYSWPGNVRELRNVAERVVVVAEKRIQKEHLRQIISVKSGLSNLVTINDEGEELLSLKEFKRRTEKDYIVAAIKKANGSITQAAQLLKIDRTYLYQKMTHHGLDRK